MEQARISHNWKSRVIWMGLGVGAIALRAALDGRPEWIERYYSRGFFLGIRWTIDYLLAWFPAPLIYVFLLALAVAAVYRTQRLLRDSRPWAVKLGHTALAGLAFLGGGVFFFLTLWGYNYGRLPIEQQLGLEVKPLSLAELRGELREETRRIIQLREQIPGAGDSALTADFLPADLEQRLRRDLKDELATHHFPTVGRVRARRLLPQGIFLRFSSSGLYFPFVGEGNVDAGIHPLQLPCVMAHEMSHGYGFGDEGTCNFLAFLSCSRSADPFITYAGHLDFWRTLAVNYRRYQPDAYRELRESLPAGIRADLDAINASLLRFPEILPHLRYAAYDTYLKTQGIEEGMLNYNRVVMLVYAWRKAREM